MSRGLFLKARLGVNGSQNALKSLGTSARWAGGFTAAAVVIGSLSSGRSIVANDACRIGFCPVRAGFATRGLAGVVAGTKKGRLGIAPPHDAAILSRVEKGSGRSADEPAPRAYDWVPRENQATGTVLRQAITGGRAMRGTETGLRSDDRRPAGSKAADPLAQKVAPLYQVGPSGSGGLRVAAGAPRNLSRSASIHRICFFLSKVSYHGSKSWALSMTSSASHLKVKPLGFVGSVDLIVCGVSVCHR